MAKLKIDVMRFKKRNFAEIVMRFSGLEELEVLVWLIDFEGDDDEMVPRYGREKVVWKDILGLKKLKKAVLPWPLVVGGGFQQVSKNHLKDPVAWWVREWGKMGEEGVIENARFVMWKYEVGEEFLDFKIMREGNHTYWRVEHGKRRYEGTLDQLPLLWDLKEMIETGTVDVDIGGWEVEEGVEDEDGGYESEGGGMEFEPWEE